MMNLADFEEERLIVTKRGTWRITRLISCLYNGSNPKKYLSVTLHFAEDVRPRIFGFVTIHNDGSTVVYDTRFVGRGYNNGDAVKCKSLIEAYMVIAETNLNIDSQALEELLAEARALNFL